MHVTLSDFMAFKTAIARVLTCMQSFRIIVVYPSSTHEVLKRSHEQVTESDCLTKCGLIHGGIDPGGRIVFRTRLRSYEKPVLRGDFSRMQWLVSGGAATWGMSDSAGDKKYEVIRLPLPAGLVVANPDRTLM
jgi:hypothetical protein